MELQLPTVLIEIEGGVAEICHDLPFNVVLIDYDTIEENDIEGTFDVLSARVAATRIKDGLANATAPEYVDYNGLFLPNWDNIGQMIGRLSDNAKAFISASIPADGLFITDFYVPHGDKDTEIRCIQKGDDVSPDLLDVEMEPITWHEMTELHWVCLAAHVQKAIAGGQQP